MIASLLKYGHPVIQELDLVVGAILCMALTRNSPNGLGIMSRRLRILACEQLISEG